MAFDGIVTKAITTELSELCNSRIDKIFQPDKNSIILGMYLNGTNYALNICIDSQNCRLHLTTNSKPNPKIAPNFCMLLRKHLLGLKLKNIITFDLERLIVLEFEGFDDVDDIISKKIVIELMGKHSNIILLDYNNFIIDSLRHIKENDQNYRNILPHIKYIFPISDKLNFLDIKNFNEFFNYLTITNISDLPSEISNNFNGISKSFIYQIINTNNIQDTNKSNLEIIYNYINNILANIGKNNLTFKNVVNSKGKTKDYFLLPEKSSSPFPLNFFIDDFYYSKESNENFNNRKNSLLKLVSDSYKKYNKRLENINQKLKECDDMDKYRIYGELITANLYKIPNENIEKIDIENYYDNNNLINIPLDKKYLPSINAKKYFKKYSKLKNALNIVSKQKLDTLEDINYLESVIYEIENSSSIEDLSFISEEIFENNLFKEKKSNLSNKKKNKIKKSKPNKELSFNPIKYVIDGYTIFVGKNNKENDYLTLKYANRCDLWFHTKDFHGSHTILKIDNALPYPNSNTLVKVAKIAALHSKAKNSSNVPVDFCEVKYVKKPSGSKPGMVIYTNNKTLNVTPEKNHM